MARLLRKRTSESHENGTAGAARSLRIVTLLLLTAVSLRLYWREKDNLLQALQAGDWTRSVTTTIDDSAIDDIARNTEEEHKTIAYLSKMTTRTQKPNCTWPYVAMENLVLPGQNPFVDILENGTKIQRKIPKIIHLAWVSLNDEAPRLGGCLHHLQAETMSVYHKTFPSYHIYYHDDDAVDKLLQPENWPEFPNLGRILKCCKMRGAMLVDIWRVLVLYKYGGLFSDLDLRPHPKSNFTERVIPADVDFFSLKDSAGRPTQNWFAMAPGNAVGNETMTLILKYIYQMSNIYEPKLVFTTGPGVLMGGFKRVYTDWSPKKKPGTFHGAGNLTALQLGNPGESIIGVSTSLFDVYKTDPETGKEISYGEQIKKDTGVIHWTNEKSRMKGTQAAMTCKDYLETLPDGLGSTLV